MNDYNIADIKRFLNYLNPDPEAVFTAAYFDKEGQIRGDLATIHGDQRKLINILKHNSGLCLHVSLNETDLGGRKTENVIKCRTICVDLDEYVSLDKIRHIKSYYQPHLIVQSSKNLKEEGKFHLYWKLQDNFPLEIWKEFQEGFAYDLKEYGADFSMNQITKMIRVPGCPRITKDGNDFTPKILLLEEKIYPFNTLGLNLIEGIPDAIIKAKAHIQKQYKELRKVADNFGKGDGGFKTSEISGVGRNNSLYFYLRTKISDVREPEIGLDAVRELGEEFNRSFSEGLRERELQDIIKSAYRKGMMIRRQRENRIKELTVPLTGESSPAQSRFTGGVVEDMDAEVKEEITEEKVHTNGKGKVSKELKGEIIDVCSDNPFSEQAIAEKVINDYREDFVAFEEKFFAYNQGDKLWIPQTNSSCKELARSTHNTIAKLIMKESFVVRFGFRDKKLDEDKLRNARDKFLKLKLKNDICRDILNSTSVRRDREYIFDRDPELILFRNGVYNLATGEFRPPKQTDYLLNKINVDWKEEVSREEYDKLAEGKEWWETFLGQVFKDPYNPGVEEEMVSFMQEVFGYSLSGYINEAKIFCHIGNGSNGKSKVMSALKAILGGYVTFINPQDLVKAGVKNEFERLANDLEGKRCVISDDMEVKSKWNEGFVKMLTEKDLRGRALYNERRYIENHCKFHLGLNRAPDPESEGTGVSLLRRLCFIPYNNYFEPIASVSEEIDRQIRGNILAIIDWSITGYKRRKARGRINYPASIGAALDEYKSETFVLSNLITNTIEKAIDRQGLPIFEEGNGYHWIEISEVTQRINEILKSKEDSPVRNQEVGKILNAEGYQVNKNIRSKTKGYAAVHVLGRFRGEEKGENLGLNFG